MKKLLALTLILATGCAIVRKKPQPATPTFRAAAIRLGPTTNTTPFQFWLPFGMVTSNWYWDLQLSTNLSTWSTLATNISGDPLIWTTNRSGFYRLRGHL